MPAKRKEIKKERTSLVRRIDPNEPVVRHDGKAVRMILLKLYPSCFVKATGCSYTPEQTQVTAP